jgi:hypothetical protein
LERNSDENAEQIPAGHKILRVKKRLPEKVPAAVSFIAE